MRQCYLILLWFFFFKKKQLLVKWLANSYVLPSLRAELTFPTCIPTGSAHYIRFGLVCEWNEIRVEAMIGPGLPVIYLFFFTKYSFSFKTIL